MNWKIKDGCKTIEEVIERNVGVSIEEFINPITSTNIKGLDQTYERIIKAVENDELITIFGDYDADGVTASAIIWATLSLLCKTEPIVRLPKRFSEGYGFSESVADEINEGLLITLDNGIAAISAIDKIKKKGIEVIVIDHHLAGDKLPKADIIVDPHVYKENEGDFEDWCGAGLAYRLSLKLIENIGNEAYRNNLRSLVSQLAAIGTICDVMPLIKDNRSIVIEGLKNINTRPCKGIKAILDFTETEYVDETTCGFLLGPLINAAGRLDDDGPLLAFDVLTACKRSGANSLVKNVETLIQYNETRKELVENALKSAEELIKNNCMYGDYPLIVVDETISEGIVGIVAGKLAEKYAVPTIVFTNSSDKNVLKGSARSFGGVDIKSMMDSASKHIVKYGGHTGAGGLSVKRNEVYALYTKMHNYMGNYDVKSNNDIIYDLEINSCDIAKNLSILKKYAPFGEGNPRIVFKINSFPLNTRLGNFFKFMGKNSEHIKLYGNGFSAVGFQLSDKYDDTKDKSIECVGTIAENVFRGIIEPQIELIDFAHCSMNKKSALQELLMARLKKDNLG